MAMAGERAFRTHTQQQQYWKPTNDDGAPTHSILCWRRDLNFFKDFRFRFTADADGDWVYKLLVLDTMLISIKNLTKNGEFF